MKNSSAVVGRTSTSFKKEKKQNQHSMQRKRLRHISRILYYKIYCVSFFVEFYDFAAPKFYAYLKYFNFKYF